MSADRAQIHCCGEIDLSQIGKCLHCVVLAATLTIVFWSGYFVLSQFHWPWLSGILLVFSCLFSLLLVTHAVASWARTTPRMETNPNDVAHPQ
jgi:hypothetical protein